ncbi:MAG TPA: hypothetical protein PKI19_06460 [Elusimicrobiales bacterium]|nr:hypothetical protein [Elusimicrobiales bacterium]
MKNKIVMWLGVMALAAAPAQVLRAQQGPEGVEEDVEITEGGPGPARAEMGMERKGPGGRQGGRGMRGMEEEQGEGRTIVKVRKIMGGGEGGGMMGGRDLMSDEDILAVIKKHDAAFAAKLENQKTAAPAKYHMAMQMAGKMLAGARMEEDAAVEKDAVRTLALEFEVKELSRKLERAQDAEKSGIKDSLKNRISELFDLKSKAQELRVKRMETDLAKLKKNLENRKANKAKIVDQRVEQLTGEGYAW